MRTMPIRMSILLAVLLLCVTPVVSSAQQPEQNPPSFVTHDNYLSCHNGLETSSGEDVSLGTAWSATMMANAARDPYWQAAVRRETIDHPEASAAIQNECSACHMPMARMLANADKRQGDVFKHLPFNQVNLPGSSSEESLLAEDGVSCSLCHQITSEDLGTEASLVAGFHVHRPGSEDEQVMFGPYEIDTGRQAIMQSAVGFSPSQGKHLQSSELCATCHTLITEALGPGGRHIGELHEQMPYQEWQHSAFAGKQSCQDCHMPVVEEDTRIASVLGPARQGLNRHQFVGGNFFIIDMLNRFRDELAVKAAPADMENAVDETIQHLQSGAAGTIEVIDVQQVDGMLTVRLVIDNAGGHKLPTAYPSRRIWINLLVFDARQQLVFESGRFNADGSIEGNDNDEDPSRFEPHYKKINQSDQVQIYEAIIGAQDGAVTTGLLTATRYLKDNRIPPRGFDKFTAPADIATTGNAMADEDFSAGVDSIAFHVDVAGRQGPFRIEADLWYQPVSYRWAENLAAYDSFETHRFGRYYRAMSAQSAIIMASAQADSQ